MGRLSNVKMVVSANVIAASIAPNRLSNASLLIAKFSMSRMRDEIEVCCKSIG